MYCKSIWLIFSICPVNRLPFILLPLSTKGRTKFFDFIYQYIVFILSPLCQLHEAFNSHFHDCVHCTKYIVCCMYTFCLFSNDILLQRKNEKWQNCILFQFYTLIQKAFEGKKFELPVNFTYKSVLNSFWLLFIANGIFG